ncbi:hypothetical protein N825_11760 [Skermanella stibiiresistens SB22]|uniref:Uncharacterized protein n=1 Tax=Skermanella stibiiresistens SB22 TaxID=1385369 RepID=W9GXI3_9PROT|nr:hypothetical protein [Skermanella stibiiresistens]EWY37351.1 hypothetical protein N825_11760 [Skermanella stibiiresistens SB22]
MTVIQFPSCRFTPADLVAFYRIALPKCARGAWASVARQTGRHHDRLLISLPGLKDAVFIFERDQGGRYRLWFKENGTRCIGSAATAEECLAVWRTAAMRRASSGAAPGR